MKSILYLPFAFGVISCAERDNTTSDNSRTNNEPVATYDRTTTCMVFDDSLSSEEIVEHIFKEQKYDILTKDTNSNKSSLTIAIKSKELDDFLAYSFTIDLNEDGSLKECSSIGSPLSSTG